MTGVSASECRAGWMSSLGIGLLDAATRGLFRLLRLWNRTINLTALPFPGLPDHSARPVVYRTVASCAFVEDALCFGSILALEAVHPRFLSDRIARSCRLTMVESKSRKAAFLREVARLLALTSALTSVDAN